jgi:Zn-dependent protease
MRSLRFSRAGRNLYCLLAIDVAQVFIAYIVLLFSLTVHELAHAWTADRLGDPTARSLGRVSLNPIVHADLFGTVIIPLVALVGPLLDRGLGAVPLIGWAKPVPVTTRYLQHPRRDYLLIAAAGPGSNLVLALAASLVGLILPVSPQTLGEPNVTAPLAAILGQLLRLNVLLAVFNMIPIPPLDGGNVLAALLPSPLALSFNRLRPYGFILLYALILTGGFEHIVVPPYQFIVSWLPTK